MSPADGNTERTAAATASAAGWREPLGNNRNNLSLGVDLTKPEGLDLLARLTEQSDVVLTNALPEASSV